METRIVEMQTEHIQNVVEIENENFESPWSFCAVDGLLENNFSVKRVCLDEENNVVGYYSFLKSFEDGYINNIAVKKSMQSKGIGRKMMTDMLSQAEKVGVENLTLEVRLSNAVAIELYKKFGFCEAGIRKKFYENKEDALIMWRTKA